MSYPGHQVLEYIDNQLALLDRRWWNSYGDRLTAAECDRLCHGDYRAFRRPHRPAFAAGCWLTVAPKLEVRVAEIQPKPGGYRIRIDAVRDFRGHQLHMRRLREDPELMRSTLAVLGSPNPPEPEGVDGSWLDRFARDARAKRGEEIREAIAA